MEPRPPNREAREAALRRLPKVDEVLAGALGQALLREAPRWAVVQAVRDEIGRLREQVLHAPEQAEHGPDAEGGLDAGAGAGAGPGPRLPLDEPRLRAELGRLVRPSLQRVVNATGVVLHTNLGRAPLPAAALQRIAEVAGGYTNLEYRLTEGERGSRHEHLGGLLAPLTGAEAHLVVNNNAAAVMLMLGALCSGREVVVSRGELVEIGGSFRVPDVMRASGARLREVGTTNRTHLSDYQAAIDGQTAALLKVHRSNFALLGFTAEVELPALCRCAKEAGLLSLCDLGSGALLPLPGLSELPGQAEPTVAEAVRSGCDLLTFSCDKLLGGPQAGVLCGRRDLIERARKHPLMRAVRPDKLTLLALCATLELYRDGKAHGPGAAVPALRMLAETEAALRARAARLQRACHDRGVPVEVVPVRSAVGGGALPLGQPPSFAVAVAAGPGDGPERLHRALRLGEPPVVGRIAEGRLLCDVRTVAEDEVEALAEALARALRSVNQGETIE